MSHFSILILASTKVPSLIDQDNVKLQRKQEELDKARELFKSERQKFEKEKRLMQKSVDNTDVLQLNIGGQIIMTTRATLTRVPKSTLATMFNGRWEHKFGKDQYGNIFLDFNPVLFSHLLEQLRVLEDGKPARFHPPSAPSLVIPFEKMLRKLGLYQSPTSEDAVVALNVGGQIVSIRQKTLNQISNLKLSAIVSSPKATNENPHINYDPKLFRHLLSQLREKQKANILYFDAPSNEDRNAFNAMLSDFNLNRKC